MQTRQISYLILALGLATFGLLTPHFAAAKNNPDLPPLLPSIEEFRAFCRQHRQAAQENKKTGKISEPEIGVPVFVPIGAVEGGQNRFAFLRFLKALKEMIKKAKFNKDKTRAEGYVGSFDNGRSLYPKERKTTGIFYRGKVYILDGHHRALISTYFGMKTLPMEIKADWSHMKPDEFLEAMKAHGYTYFYNFNGEIEAPRGSLRFVE